MKLEESAILGLTNLHDYHKNLIDHILECQAIAGGMAILNSNKLSSQYSVRVEL